MIVPLTPHLFENFSNLICALADYENLLRPTPEALSRLREDAFAQTPRFWAHLAHHEESQEYVGYTISFETYSSFLAKPTMYLEDLFVLPEYRNAGLGNALFENVQTMGLARGCGRMEWQVLDWNNLARDFYHKRNAQHMQPWLLYRIEY